MISAFSYTKNDVEVIADVSTLKQFLFVLFLLTLRYNIFLRMRKIEKYRTFEELNLAEKPASDIKQSLKKHANYEALLQKIYQAKSDNGSNLKHARMNGR